VVPKCKSTGENTKSEKRPFKPRAVPINLKEKRREKVGGKTPRRGPAAQSFLVWGKIM